MKNLIKREYYLKKIDSALKNVSIVILVGARQVGKTSLMEMLDYTPCLFLNGQNPEIAGLFERVELVEEYIKINLSEEFNGYLLLDEFQYIDNITDGREISGYPDIKSIQSESRSERTEAGSGQIADVFISGS